MTTPSGARPHPAMTSSSDATPAPVKTTSSDAAMPSDTTASSVAAPSSAAAPHSAVAPGKLLLSEPLAAAETDLWTTEEERAEAARFGSARRRSEYLTWRTLVRRELGRDAVIGYNGVGAPVVTSPEGYFIGVSHCRERVAVCISRQRCAVDIESVSRNFGAALARCMTPRERTLSTDERLGAALWCAKEALYKYAGRRELELQRDVQVLGVDFEAGRIVGRICGGEPLELQLRCIDGCVVVWRC